MFQTHVPVYSDSVYPDATWRRLDGLLLDESGMLTRTSEAFYG